MKQLVGAVVLVLVPLFMVLAPTLEAAETEDPKGLKQRVEQLEALEESVEKAAFRSLPATSALP